MRAGGVSVVRRRLNVRRVAVVLAMGWLVASGASGEQPPERCGSPAEAAVADRLLTAFDDHRFVFFGSTHGGVKRHRFLLCLLSRPAFERVKDVVVEFASGARQELLDRYLLELDELSPEELRPVAFDTDYPQLLATLPQVPELLAAVRAINEGAPLAERVRVLGGSDTVDWSRVRTVEDLAPYPFKTNWVAHLITEHLAPERDRRVLVVYGDGHIQHGDGTLMAELEAELDPADLFVVGTITDLAEGERGAVAAFGDPDTPFYLAADAFPAVDRVPESLVPMVTTSRRQETAVPGLLARKMDALVYLGPEPDVNFQGTIPFSQQERQELDRRDGLRGRGSMEIRYGGRDLWFERHPSEIPPDPRRAVFEK